MNRHQAYIRRNKIVEIIQADESCLYRTLDTWERIVGHNWYKDSIAPSRSTIRRVLDEGVVTGHVQVKKGGRGWYQYLLYRVTPLASYDNV